MGLVIVPSIDLRGGQVVRLAQGDYARQTRYALQPLAAAAGFLAAGAQWLHVVDLDGAKQGRPVQTELIAALAAKSGLKVQVGGGVRCTADIDRLLQAGANRVVVGTQAMEDWPWFEKLAHSAQYRDRLVLALDAKDGVIATRGWTASAGRAAGDVARQVSGWKLAAILYTDVARDGMLGGANLEQTRLIAEAGDVPVIASGGVGNIGHVRQLTRLPIWGVIVGRSLYEGKLDLAAAIRAAATTHG
jgi:phosphoribosylformimino-5-aminoimidazole carboxamide ribotide isomerase